MIRIVLSLLALSCVLTILICWIKVLIATFNKAGVGLGILALLCSPFSFIWGWVKSTEYGLKKIMMIWTIALGVGIILCFIGGGIVASNPEFQKGLEKGMKEAAERNSQK